jgi:SAM-dependent methyltransferase
MTATPSNAWSGVRELDWAQLQEQCTLPLQAAVLDAGKISRGTRMLDAGCGTGILSVLASLRGAEVTAIDGSEAMLRVARQRLPSCDVRLADLEALPFESFSFDSVLAVNSLFFARDVDTAMREVARVLDRGGRVVATCWGPPERCQYTAVREAMATLGPPASSPSRIGPSTLAEPGAFEAVFARAGLRVVARGVSPCAMVYPKAEVAWLAHASSAPTQAAIRTYGEEVVRHVLEEVDARHTRPDGTISFENEFVWAAGERA